MQDLIMTIVTHADGSGGLSRVFSAVC